jgi:hypothetical protein
VATVTVGGAGAKGELEPAATTGLSKTAAVGVAPGLKLQPAKIKSAARVTAGRSTRRNESLGKRLIIAFLLLT